MPPPATRRILSGLALAVALGLLVLGVLYQADTSPEDGVTQSGEAVAGPTGPEATPATENPVVAWFPRSGQGAACTEPVGVALRPGFQASLTINGVPIGDGELNDRASAAGTLNHYTWGPEPDCPRGQLIRTEGNELQACVWRVSEPPSTCRVYRHPFDAL